MKHTLILIGMRKIVPPELVDVVVSGVLVVVDDWVPVGDVVGTFSVEVVFSVIVDASSSVVVTCSVVVEGCGDVDPSG